MSDWLHDAIVDGLTQLASLGLDFTPPDDALQVTVPTWINAIIDSGWKWDEVRDKPRIAAAFRSLCRTRERWPLPKHLLAEMPPPDVLALSGPKEAPADTPELREAMKGTKGTIEEARQALEGFTLAYSPDGTGRVFVAREATQAERDVLEQQARERYAPVNRKFDARSAAAGDKADD